MLAETPETQCSSCYSAVSSSSTNPLPDYSNYLPFCHTHYLILWINTSLVSLGQTFTKPLRWRLILHRCSALLQNLVGTQEKRSALRKLKERQVLMFLILLFKLSSQLSLFSLSLSSILSLLPFLISPSLSTIHSFSSDQIFVLLR